MKTVCATFPSIMAQGPLGSQVEDQTNCHIQELVGVHCYSGTCIFILSYKNVIYIIGFTNRPSSFKQRVTVNGELTLLESYGKCDAKNTETLIYDATKKFLITISDEQRDSPVVQYLGELTVKSNSPSLGSLMFRRVSRQQ